MWQGVVCRFRLSSGAMVVYRSTCITPRSGCTPAKHLSGPRCACAARCNRANPARTVSAGSRVAFPRPIATTGRRWAVRLGCGSVWFPTAARHGGGRGSRGCPAHRHGISTAAAAPIHRPRPQGSHDPAVYLVQSSPLNPFVAAVWTLSNVRACSRANQSKTSEFARTVMKGLKRHRSGVVASRRNQIPVDVAVAEAPLTENSFNVPSC